MGKLTLNRTTRISGTTEHVIVHGDTLEDSDLFLKVMVVQDVKSELGKNDWRAGETVHIPKELIKSN